jgi:hypothetical protein
VVVVRQLRLPRDAQARDEAQQIRRPDAAGREAVARPEDVVVVGAEAAEVE